MRALKFVGYLIGFLALLVILVLLFIDPIAKYIIEREGSKVVKAKVDVEDVDVRFIPLGVSLHGLQVTNPQQPTNNAIQASLVDANLEFAPLLKSKVIVNDAKLSGMLFNTQRQSSGAIPGLTPPPSDQPSLLEELKADLKLPSIDVPDPDTLLAKIDLQTVKLAEELETSLDARKSAWQARVDRLPSKETLEGYKDRIRALKESKDILKRVQALKDVANIQKDVKKDLESIRSAQKDLKSEIAAIKADIARVRQAPQQDIERALALVGLDAEAWQGLAGGLFGSEVAQWIGNAQVWYQRLQPYLSGGGKGEAQVERVDTTDYSDGLPKFLVKHLEIDGSLPLPQETVPFSGEFNDLTDQAHIWGRPAQLALRSQSARIGELDFKGVLNHVNPANTKDAFNLALAGLPIKDLTFSKDSDFPITLAQAIATVAGQAEISNNNLNLNVDTKFVEVQLANLLKDVDAPVKKALLQTLQQVSEIGIKLIASGELNKPNVKLTSTLDRVLGDSVKNLVKQEQQKITKQLNAKLSKVADEKLAGIDGELSGLVNLDGLLQERISALTNLL